MAQELLSIGQARIILGSMETLGELINGAMKRRGRMAGKTLAVAIGKQESYVSKLRRNSWKDIPPPEVLAAVEHVLGIPQERMLRAIGYSIDGTGAAAPPAYDALSPDEQAIIDTYRALSDDHRAAVGDFAEFLANMVERPLRPREVPTPIDHSS